jgi:hypothetical protein
VKSHRQHFCCALLFIAILAWAHPLWAQSLDVKIEGDHLRVSVGSARLIAGESLQKLRDGSSVTYLMRVSAWSGKAGKLLSSTEYRFVVSFDIFEEKFQVTRIMPSAKVASHLSLTAAETACTDGLEIPLAGIGTTMPFWVRWEFQAEYAVSEETGGGLGSIVDLFALRTPKDPTSAFKETGPYRTADLPRYSPPPPNRR